MGSRKATEDEVTDLGAKKAHITVSNSDGHLCHIRAVSNYKSTPKT